MTKEKTPLDKLLKTLEGLEGSIEVRYTAHGQATQIARDAGSLGFESIKDPANGTMRIFLNAIRTA